MLRGSAEVGKIVLPNSDPRLGTSVCTDIYNSTTIALFADPIARVRRRRRRSGTRRYEHVYSSAIFCWTQVPASADFVVGVSQAKWTSGHAYSSARHSDSSAHFYDSHETPTM